MACVSSMCPLLSPKMSTPKGPEIVRGRDGSLVLLRRGGGRRVCHGASSHGRAGSPRRTRPARGAVLEERSRSAIGERPRLRPAGGPPVAGQTRAVPGSTRQSPSSRPSTQLLAMEFGRGAGSSSRWSAAAAKQGRAEQSGAGATLGAVRAGPPAPRSADPVPTAPQPRRVAPPLAAWRQRAAEPGRGRSRRSGPRTLGAVSGCAAAASSPPPHGERS